MIRPNVYGILPTYQRPLDLATTLARLRDQTRRLDHLYVIDNSPTDASRELVERSTSTVPVTYVASRENIGNAGAYALGMERALAIARDEDWITLLDDDDPPDSDSVFEDLVRFANLVAERDPSVGGVGFSGARFDPARGAVVRVPDAELRPCTPIDYIGNGHFPLYRVRAIRDVGPMLADLFFGFPELEYGLRLRRASYSLYMDGDRVAVQRTTYRRRDVDLQAPRGLQEITWQRYYKIRNLVFILRRFGYHRAAARVVVVRGFMKPVIHLLRHPRDTSRHLRLNWRACRDGWVGRLGRVVEPPTTKDGDEPVVPAPAAQATVS